MLNLFKKLMNAVNFVHLPKEEKKIVVYSEGKNYWTIFDEIICIDPFKGEEEKKNIFNEDWSRVKKEFYTNTRYWDYIKLIQDYSYNVVENFKDGYFDFIYIDGNHTYESVKQDIKLYLPKCKTIIGGHDYRTTGWEIEVVKAIHEQLSTPDLTFIDSSWIKYL